MAKKSGLGKGLDALFDDNNFEDEDEGVQNIRLSQIEPNKSQPRQRFDEAAIQNLADSIRQHGLIQPILVREYGSGYQIVAGERRYRACRMLGLSEVPVIVKEYSDSETAQIALIENIQREDLNPIEEAAAYKELMENYEMTQEELSKTVGKSRSTIANSVRLLAMPEEIKSYLVSGELSVGHAKAISSANSEKEMLALAEKSVKGELTVRGVEKQIKQNLAKLQKEIEVLEPQTDNYFKELELGLKESLGRKVKVSANSAEKGSLTIEFYDKEDLADLIQKFM